MTEKQENKHSKHPMKKWDKVKGENSWTMFKVISEFVMGFETLNKLGPCVSIFGSARTKPDHPYYKLAVDIARLLTDEGYGVITGGGPGIMEAGNKGAHIYGGKSVGLNAVLSSLLFKKHPAEVKFVLVDPKKVELTLYNKIERHYLAKLPDTDEAIITDNKKVINTLNSLCIEMDNRYELLKNASCRNIVEYNKKF